MDTPTLRSLIKAAATGIPGARLHPNGLGFDHHGTSYRINERVSTAKGAIVWEASRRVELMNDWAVKYGEGPTPEAAKRAAGIGRPEHRTRGGV
jgi:hypothetical protein